MLTMFRTRAVRPLIGLDIGVTGIRAAQVVRGDRGWRVREATLFPRASATGASAATSLTEGVRGCLRDGRFRGRGIAAGLNAPEVEFQALELPEDELVGSAEAIEGVVRGEITRGAHDPGEETEIRFWRLPKSSAHAPHVLGVAARREAVVESVEACRLAGWECVRVDAAALALARAGRVLLPAEEEEVWGVLDVSVRETRLVLCVGDTPLLVRAVGSGGEDWTKRITERLGVSEETAEIHKCEHGIPSITREPRGERTPRPVRGVDSLVLGALRPDLTAIASEIKRSYEYALGCHPRGHASTLIVAGGGAQTRHLPEFFGQLLGIPVTTPSALLKEPACRLTYEATAHPLEVILLAVGLSIPGETPT